MANNTVHTITLSGYTATTDGNCWALQLGTWDSYGIEQIQLKLGQEWAGLVITATFTPPKGRKAVKVVVDSSGLFDVPQEATALAGQGTITFAGNTSGQQRISVDVPYVVANHAAVDGVTPAPTPSEWAQFVAQVQQARDDAEAAAQAAEGSQAASAGSASAAAGSAAAAAQSAQEAQNIVDGTVQDITDAKNAAVQAVNDAGNTAVQAVQAAQTTAVGAVNAAGDAKIEQIEQINALVPTPTPEDAGKVVVVKPDGTGYELGDAGSEIDDTVVASGTTWSSLNIVKKLCPPFSVTGDVVQFAPIEGYPLSVQSAIAATQEGTGDPSPENIRPIVPVDQVGVWVGGKNLCPYGSPTFTGYYQASFGFFIPAGTYVFSALVTADDADYNNNLVYFFNTKTGKGVVSKTIRRNARQAFSVSVPDIFDAIYLYASVGASQSVGKTATFADIQLELGSAATAYEPYRGKLYTAQLDEPCYGGEIDLTGGTGEANRAAVVVTGDEELIQSQSGGRVYFLIVFPDLPHPKSGGNVVVAQREQLCNLGTIGNPYSDDVDNCAWVYDTQTSNTTLRFRFSSLFNDTASAQAQLKAWYEAGTPLTVTYDSTTPTPFTIDPLSIPAPASPATAYSTAGEITVSGRSDPIEYINQQIANAVAIAKA